MCRLPSNPPLAVKKSDLAIEFGCTPGGYNDWIKSVCVCGGGCLGFGL